MKNISENNDRKISVKNLIKIIALICIVIFLIIAAVFNLKYIPFAPYETNDIVMLLLMLSFVALIIERVVEVIMIFMGRSAGEKAFLDDVYKLKKALKEKTAIADNIKNSETELRKYKEVTKIYSTTFLFIIGIIVSAIGLRVLLPLVDMSAFKYLTKYQKIIFNIIDIIITGALLGGGSKGIHEIVQGVINSLEWYRKFVKNKQDELANK